MLYFFYKLKQTMKNKKKKEKGKKACSNGSSCSIEDFTGHGGSWWLWKRTQHLGRPRSTDRAPATWGNAACQALMLIMCPLSSGRDGQWDVGTASFDLLSSLKSLWAAMLVHLLSTDFWGSFIRVLFVCTYNESKLMRGRKRTIQ